jgi:hypothetical protein
MATPPLSPKPPPEETGGADCLPRLGTGFLSYHQVVAVTKPGSVPARSGTP